MLRSSRHLMLALCAIAVAAGVHAQEGTASYQEQLQRFFSTLQEGKFGEAVDALYGGNPWMKGAGDEVSKLRGQFVLLPDIAGKLHGVELLSEKVVAGRLAYLWYVARFDRTPVSFHFTFYRPDERWFVYSFQYREDLDDLAQEMARRELLGGS